MELEVKKQEERKVKKSVIENQLPKDFEPLLLNMQSGMVSEHGWVCGLGGQAARFKSQLTTQAVWKEAASYASLRCFSSAAKGS